jgi:hypothetical protein
MYFLRTVSLFTIKILKRFISEYKIEDAPGTPKRAGGVKKKYRIINYIVLFQPTEIKNVAKKAKMASIQNYTKDITADNDVNTEIWKYMTYQVEPEEDLLDWWKRHSEIFPRLSVVFRPIRPEIQRSDPP